MAMTVLDVYLNDRKLCRAGVGNDGVLDAIISWVKLTGDAATEARRRQKPLEEARLHVGGLRDDVHRSWSARRLRTGDRVAVIVNRASSFDAPARQKRRDPKKDAQLKRQYYERLKQEFEKPPPGSTGQATAENETKFLNVDLDVWSAVPLDSLVQAFGKHVVVLSAGKEGRRYGTHLELSVESKNADQLLARFVKHIERLPRAARRLWDQARARELNIGIQAASKPHGFELRLQPETLAAVARVNARIGVTVYGAV
jgi:hypothetical protein